MVTAAAQKRVNRPSAMHRPPRVSRAMRAMASGSAVMRRSAHDFSFLFG
jgi:hypothetical protein